MMAYKNKKSLESLGVICTAHHFIMMNHPALIFLVVSQISTGPEESWWVRLQQQILTMGKFPSAECNNLKRFDPCPCMGIES